VERLWTPWRSTYVQGAADDAEPGCFLCTSPQAGDDPARLILFRAERVFVVMNLFPYNTGHLLVAPYEHTGGFATLDPDTASELIHTVQHCVAVLEAEDQPHAFNIGMNLGKPAGAGVPDHLHQHIVPRWNGDTNFMPILGDTKVMPETLDQTYARLRRRLQG
jgi:ATP adenylyltransferase